MRALSRDGVAGRVGRLEVELPKIDVPLGGRSKRKGEERRPFWLQFFKKQQEAYDHPEPESKLIKRLREQRERVRQQYRLTGQEPLEKGNMAITEAVGVIYAVVVRKRIYVGQTNRTLAVRFKEHVSKSLSKKGDTPFHRELYQQGLNAVSLFLLERVPAPMARGRKDVRSVDKDVFVKRASPIENSWIRRLQTHVRSKGFNVMAMRGRKRRQRPMAWRRKQLLAKRQLREEKQRAWQLRVHGDAAAAVEAAVARADVEERPGSRRFGYRDYDRRLHFLLLAVQRNALDVVKFDEYVPRNLSRMLHILEQQAEAKRLGYTDRQRCEVMKALRSALQKRPWQLPSNRKKHADHHILKIEWQSRMLRSIPLKSIMCERDVLELAPQQYRQHLTSNIIICRKLVKALGPTIFNFTAVSKRMQMLGADDTCPCRKLFDRKYRPDGGCVRTGDLAIVNREDVRKLMEYGPRFRLSPPAPPDLLNALSEALDEFVERYVAPEHVHDMKPWKCEVLARCRVRVEKARHLDANAPNGVVMTEQMKKYLRWLKRYLVVVPADKAANNVVFVCKTAYVKQLRQELDKPVYATVADTAEDIVQRQRNYLSRRKLDDGKNGLKYLYWMPKIHKRGERYIAGGVNCSTRKVSVVTAKALQLVLNTLRVRDDNILRATGVRRFFVVNGYEEVADFLRRWPRREELRRTTNRFIAANLYTGDFSTMYTTIPHDDLVEQIKWCCRRAWRQARRQLDVGRDATVRLKVNTDDARWVREDVSVHTQHVHSFTLDELTGLVEWCIGNTYLVNGDSVRRQVIGIPMGSNNAPCLANLYLYAYESKYVKKVQTTNPAKAEAMHMTFRLIDDVCALDNPRWRRSVAKPAEEGGIYPSALKLNETTVNAMTTNFLGMTIQQSPSKDAFISDVYDKRKEFPFAVRRYPHMSSLIPESIPYGVFMGQLHRFCRICTRRQTFIAHAREIANVLVKQGCSESKIRKVFRRFVSKKAAEKYHVRMRRLMKEFSEAVVA